MSNKNYNRKQALLTTAARFAPFGMFLRMYSACVLLWDFTWLFFYSIYWTLESMYQVIKPPRKKSIDGEIALIVGASRGVGREIALQLSSLGVELICCDINSADNESTVKKVLNAGGRAHAYTCDVTNREEVLKMVQLATSEVGDISMLFHCCGVPSPRSLLAHPPPNIKETMDVSVMSHFWLLEAVLPRMKEMNYGHIVAMTSVAGLSGLKHEVALSASQFAVQGLIESVSEELRKSEQHCNIQVTIAHVYPFILSNDLAKDIRMRIPSYFGRIDAGEAARQIIDGIRRNFAEISIPGYLLYLGHALRILPRKSTYMLRDLLDTGLDFG